MIRVVVVLLALAAGGVAAFWVARDPGYLLVAYDGTTLETSVWFALLCAIALGGVLWLTAFAGRRLLRVGAAVATRAGRRRATRARAKAQRGTMLLAEGRWREAIDNLLASATAGATPLANYLGAARAANRLGSHDERDDILRRAGKALPEAAFVLDLTRAELQQAAGQWRQSAQTLEALREQAPRHSLVVERLFRAYRTLGDAEAAARLAPELPKGGDLEEVRLAAWRAGLGASSSAAQVRDTWRAVPKALRGSESLVLDYVDALVRHDAEDEAEVVLRRALKKRWRACWVLRYGSIGGDAAKRRANAGGWLPKHDQDAALELTLGRLARADGDSAAARRHLLRSIDLDAAPAALVEMGRLCAGEGQHAAAVEYLERALVAGLDSAVNARPTGALEFATQTPLRWD